VQFPIAIEPGNEQHAFGVVVPDLPGCFSAGDTLGEAIDNVKEAIELWLEEVINNGGAIPEPLPISKHQSSPEYKDWVWVKIEINLNR
jgi:predicted RNase H-like HicB family nuclease